MSFIYQMRSQAVQGSIYSDLFTSTTPPPQIPIICIRIITHAKYPFVQVLLRTTSAPGSGTQSVFGVPVLCPSTDSILSVDRQAEIYIHQLLQQSPSFAPSLHKLHSDSSSDSDSNSDSDSDNSSTEAIAVDIESPPDVRDDGPPKQIQALGVITDHYENIYILVDISAIPTPAEIHSSGSLWSPRDPLCMALPSEIINVGSVWGCAIHPATVRAFTQLPDVSIIHVSTTEHCIPTMYPVPDVAYSIAPQSTIQRAWHLGMPRQQLYKSCGEYIFLYDAWPNANQRRAHSQEGGVRVEPVSIGKFAIFHRGGGDSGQVYIEDSDVLTLTDADIESTYGTIPCISIRFINTDNYEYICDDSLKPNLLIRVFGNHVPLGWCKCG